MLSINFRIERYCISLCMLAAIAMPKVSHAQIEITDTLRLGGFGTFSATKSDNEVPILAGRDITDEWCYDCDSTLGVQADWLISSKFRTTIQVVKRPEDTYSSPELERVQLEYNIGTFRAKIGRLRTPLFLMSEYYFVSNAYPWLRLPPEVYNNTLGITNYEGIALDFYHEFESGKQLVVSPFGALSSDEKLKQYGITYDLDLSDAFGFSTELFYGDNLVRFAYVNIDVTVSGPIPPPSDYDLDIFSLGLSHYFGELHFQAETVLEDDLYANWYVSFDYQLGKVTPYISYGQARIAKDTESVLAGFRYDWTPQINISVEWQRFYGRENVISGQFTKPQDPSKPFSSKVDLFSVGFSFTF